MFLRFVAGDFKIYAEMRHGAGAGRGALQTGIDNKTCSLFPDIVPQTTTLFNMHKGDA